jgi:hypothetical protein
VASAFQNDPAEAFARSGRLLRLRRRVGFEGLLPAFKQEQPRGGRRLKNPGHASASRPIGASRPSVSGRLLDLGLTDEQVEALALLALDGAAVRS